MGKLGRNVVANLLGRGINIVLSILLVPVFLRVLGSDVYGLIGLYGAIAAVVGLLDMGIGGTLSRELAKLSGQPGSEAEQQALLRTLELAVWLVSIVAALIVFLTSDIIAAHWLHSDRLSQADLRMVVNCFAISLVALLPTGLYTAGLMGLQFQVQANMIIVGVSLAKNLGAAVLIVWFVPTAEAFFLWQAVTAVGGAALLGWALWRKVGRGLGARFDRGVMRGRWGFTAAMSLNGIVGVGLTQTDKVLLSKFLPLDAFGHYMLASTIAWLFWALLVPVNMALSPHITKLQAEGRSGEMRDLYHLGCQFMALATVPLATTLIVFGEYFLTVWLHDQPLAVELAPVLSLLVAAGAVNALVSVPLYTSVALGWPHLITYCNLAILFIVIPANFLFVPTGGMVVAATIWLGVNMFYIFVGVPAMHRKFLPSEFTEYAFGSTIVPLCLGALTALGLKIAASSVEGYWNMIMLLIANWLLCSLLIFLTSSRLRTPVIAFLKGRLPVSSG